MKKIFNIGSSHVFIKKWKDLSHKYKYKHTIIFPKATFSPWESDNSFLKVYNVAKGHTLVDIYRSYELWHLVKQTNGLEGHILEVGVWRGGTGALLIGAAKDSSNVYLCDTFLGVVKAGNNDNVYKGGEHADTSINEVKALLSNLNFKNYTILKGIFPEETAGELNQLTFRFCHIDVDVYSSAKDIFLWIWPRLVVGGVVVFDDYGFAACEGITTLVNSEIATRKDLIMLHNINGHAVIIKIS
jgi:O-methyltransferase